ncbi:MAG: TonB-dependent receptor [Pseudomonadota bacterium]
MRDARGGRLLVKCALGSAAIAAGLCAPAVSAQQVDDPPQSAPDGQADEGRPEIVVTGIRGSAITDIAPLAELDAGAIAATGATTMPELLQAIRGTTQTADGAEPIFLLNAQRVSGYPEIGSLPPEAIEKVEVLPEQAALRFGFPPTRRVVNFITKRRFRLIEARASAGTTTRWGSATEKANLGITRLHDDRRVTLGLELRRTDPLFQSERDIAPDPDIPFDAIGNVTGLGGGEIDPALSAVAGRVVTIAPVPGDPTLAGFAAGANQPRLSDPGPYRTLAPRNEAVKAEAVVADRIGKTLAGSISLSAEQSRDRSLGGPATARLIVPGTNPYSPFAGPVILNRYLTEADPLHQRETTTTLHAGVTVRGAMSGWRWDFTGALDQKQVDGRGERGIDPAAANAAIAAGANPFAPLDASLLAARLTDRTMLRTRTAGAKAVATNTPIRLPAGKVTVTATVEAERATAASSSRGPNPSNLQLGRSRIEAGVAVDIPLASRREGVLPFIGELSVNASATIREVGGVGTLSDTTYGLAWGPIEGVQILATLRRSAAAPDMAQQLTPVLQVPNVPVFDYGNGRTELVTLIRGGNPDLAAERRLTRSLALTVKPFGKRELRFAATYEITTIRDQTGTVYAITPQTEAILPALFRRDSAGRLVSVEYRPINFSLERQRTLNLTVTANGKLGTPPPPSPPPPPGTRSEPPPQPPGYYAGIGPCIKFSDRLQLRPGAPELDLLAGDTVRGWGMPRVYGYAYGGFYHRGNGMRFSAWYQAPNRVRSAAAAADLRYASIFKLDVGAYINISSLLKLGWQRRMRLALDVTNITDSRQRVRDGNGTVPNRFQPDYIDPVGRTVTLTLRKLF